MSSVDQIGWQAQSKTGVIAAGGAGAVAAGIEILGAGGNAADAAAGAVIIALNVTDHGACSIGGEVPVLVWDGECGQVAVRSGARAAVAGGHCLVHGTRHPGPRHQDGSGAFGRGFVHYPFAALRHTELCRDCRADLGPAR